MGCKAMYIWPLLFVWIKLQCTECDMKGSSSMNTTNLFTTGQDHDKHNDGPGKVKQFLSVQGTDGINEWHLVCRILNERIIKWKTWIQKVTYNNPFWLFKKRPWKNVQKVARSIIESLDVEQEHTIYSDNVKNKTRSGLKNNKRRLCSFVKLFKMSKYFEEYSNATVTDRDVELFPYGKSVLNCSNTVYKIHTRGSTRYVQNVVGICNSTFVESLNLSYHCYNGSGDGLVSMFMFRLNDTATTINRSHTSDFICEKSRESFHAKIILAVRFLSVHTLFIRFLISLSIFSLLIALALYLFFEQLRTIPGLCNMCLSGNLVLIYVIIFIYTFDIQHSGVCSILGLADHIFRLSTVLWVNVCVFHMFRVFVLFKPNTGIYFSRKCVFVYFVYVYCVVLILVMYNITGRNQTTDQTQGNVLPGNITETKQATDQTQGDVLSSTITGSSQTTTLTQDYDIPGYDSNTCEIFNDDIGLWTSDLPAGVTVLINVCLIFIIWVRTWWRPIIQSNNSSNRRMLLFYSIVTVVVGVHGLFKYVFFETNNRTLGHIFALIHSLYGVGFLIVFLNTPQIRWLKIFWRLTHKRHPYEQNVAPFTKSASFP